jgi:ribosomal protein S18 acetylase RimI-like enzyme
MRHTPPTASTDWPVIVVPARACDFEAISAFLPRAYVDTYGCHGISEAAFDSEAASRQLLARLAAKFADPDTTVLLAARNDAVVGIVDFTITSGADTAEVNQFYVDRSHHGLGVGSALWSAMEGSLRSSGVRVTFLHVATTSVRARQFYAARSFRDAWHETWRDHTWTMETPPIEYIKMVRDNALMG